MIHIARRAQEDEMQAKMLLQVHDELVFECPTSEEEHLKSMIREEMEVPWSYEFLSWCR